MVFKKDSWKVIGTIIALVIGIIGLSQIGYDFTNFTTFLIYLMVALVLLFEVGIKFAIKNITKLNVQQYITLTIAGLIAIVGLAELFNLTIPLITQTSGFIVMAGAVMFGIEAWRKG